MSLKAAPDTELLREGLGEPVGCGVTVGLVPFEVLCSGDICIFNGVLFCLFVKGQLWW